MSHPPPSPLSSVQERQCDLIPFLRGRFIWIHGSRRSNTASRFGDLIPLSALTNAGSSLTLDCVTGPMGTL